MFGGDTFLLVGVGPLDLSTPDAQGRVLDLQGTLAALPGVVDVRGPFEAGDPVRRAQDELPRNLELLAAAADRAAGPAAGTPFQGISGIADLASRSTVTPRAELDVLRAELGGSMGFLLLNEQPARALPLYQQAQRAALRALTGLGPAAASAAAELEAGRSLGERALAALDDPQARRSLFAWAFARGLEVRARLGEPRLLADLPRVDALMGALLRRDEALSGPQLYFALRRAAPPALGGDPAASRRHFEVAARLQSARTGRQALLVRVLEARSLAPLLAATAAGAGADALEAAQRRAWEAFAGPLNEVLAAPPPRPPFDAEDLAQEVAQRQAAAMLADPGAFGVLPPDAAAPAPAHTAASVWTTADSGGQALVGDGGRLAGVVVFPAPDLGPRERATLVAGVEAALASSGLPGTLARPEAITHDLDQASQVEGGAGEVVHLRITALCRTTSSEAFHALVQDLRGEVPASLRDGPGARLRITGAVPLLVRVQDLLVDTQLRSFGAALAVVTLALLFAFRALGPVLLSLVPNVLPILITLGAMGLSGIPLNTATVTVAGIALGLVVDDTIHLLHGLVSAQRRGFAPADALARTLVAVGRPVATTTAAVALGFGVFALSPFRPTHYFGLLIAVTCIGALICDLVVLPALVLLRDRGVVPEVPASTIQPS